MFKIWKNPDGFFIPNGAQQHQMVHHGPHPTMHDNMVSEFERFQMEQQRHDMEAAFHQQRQFEAAFHHPQVNRVPLMHHGTKLIIFILI